MLCLVVSVILLIVAAIHCAVLGTVSNIVICGGNTL